MSVVCLHPKNVAYPNKSTPFVPCISKTGVICRLQQSPAGFESKWKSSNQKPEALETWHSLEPGWESMAWSQNWVHFKGKEKVLFTQKGDSLMHKGLFQTSKGPHPQLKHNLLSHWRTKDSFLHFLFKCKLQKIYILSDMCVSVFSLQTQAAFRENHIHQHVGQAEPLKKIYISHKKKDLNWHFGMTSNPIKREEKITHIYIDMYVYIDIFFFIIQKAGTCFSHLWLMGLELSQLLWITTKFWSHFPRLHPSTKVWFLLPSFSVQ